MSGGQTPLHIAISAAAAATDSPNHLLACVQFILQNAASSAWVNQDASLPPFFFTLTFSFLEKNFLLKILASPVLTLLFLF